MDDNPYSTPEDDPFHGPLFVQPRHTNSSMLNRWIMEQRESHRYSEGLGIPSGFASGTRSNPYLAYPDIGRPLSPNNINPSASTLESYDMLDDEDLPVNSYEYSCSVIPDTPEAPPPDRSIRSSLLSGSAPSFRALRFSLKSPPPSPMDAAVPKSSLAHLSLFSHSGRSTPQSHHRSSSVGVPHNHLSSITSSPKLRPSVLGYFSSVTPSQSSIPSENFDTPSRPSISSSNTCTSFTAPISTPPFDPVRTSKLSLVDSLFSRNGSRVGGSLLGAGEVGVLRKEQLQSMAAAFSERNSVSSTGKRGSIRVPFTPKTQSGRDGNLQRTVIPEGNEPQIVYSKENTVPKVSFSSLATRNSKKKTLVISGIGQNEGKKLDGVKNWCQSFGEVGQILRMPNGDLHVNFKSAEVADMVCKLRAKVYISGVGSVNLSWFTGKKR